jgi:hypothetical protein
MTLPITGITVVTRRATIEAHYPGGVQAYEAAMPATRHDDSLVGTTTGSAAEAERLVAQLVGRGVPQQEVAVIDPEDRVPSGWLRVERGNPATATLSEPVARFEVLSRSDSGLHFVRERRGGLMRVLTESELADFNDPPPCPQCAEQFGCEHINCAGEPLLSESEISSEVPAEWSAFARDYGVSRSDLERLRAVERHEGEFRLSGAIHDADMRTRELVLLLNEAR